MQLQSRKENVIATPNVQTTVHASTTVVRIPAEIDTTTVAAPMQNATLPCTDQFASAPLVGLAIHMSSASNVGISS